MSLAAAASNAIPAIPGVALTCHVATWYWAAMTAQAAGLSVAKRPIDTLANIATMRMPAQAAILALVPSGKWDFARVPMTPPEGCVLVWPKGGTHSAVVTAPGIISGYNQPAQFPHLAGQFGYTSAPPMRLGADHKQCVVVSEATIVAQAAALGL